MQIPTRTLALITTAILASFASSSTILAQVEAPGTPQTPTAVAASSSVLKAFGLERGTIQNLSLPTTIATAFQVNVVLMGRTYTLDLQPNDIRAVDFKLLVDDGKELTQVPAGPVTTYQGVIAGLAKTGVAASLYRGQLWAEIHTTGGVFEIQPISEELPKQPRASHVVYAKRNVTRLNTRCGVVHPPIAPAGPGQSNNGSVRLEAELAVDADNAFYMKNGSNVGNTQNAVLRVLNPVDLIYKRDIDLQYRITTMIVRTGRVYSSSTTSTLLVEMRTRWMRYHINIRRDLAHMFTGVGTFSGVIGTAYVNVVCGTYAYGVSKAFSTTMSHNIGVVAHEMGHNWAAGHCDNSTPCYIMCSSLNGCSASNSLFGPAAKGQIIAHKNSRTCLSTPVPGTYTYYGAGCKGTGAGCSTTCASLNAAGGTLVVRNLPNEYCYGVPPSTSSRTVCGLQFYTQVVSGTTRTMNCSVYLQANSTTPLTTPAATGKMTVGTAAGFYSMTFSTPIIVPAGQRIWISQWDTMNIRAASLSTGTAPSVATYRRQPAGGASAWLPTGIIKFPSWKLLCAASGGGNSVPLLTNTGLPNIGKTFGLRVTEAKNNAPVVFIYSVSKTTWGTIPLPLNLTFLGAPGCFLNSSYDLVLITSSSASGVASTSAPMPNQTALIGALFYNQAYVVDSGANAIGLAMTRGGEGKIGNF